MRTSRTRAKSRDAIPIFRTRQEEAEFWDTHSIADYRDEMTPVRARAARLSEPITIRLDPTTLSELRSIGSARGIGPTTLIRMWVLERLAEEHASRRNRSRSR